MTKLRNLQDRFKRSLLESNAALISDEILADGLTPEERYNIYRNNSFTTLAQALAQNFPVLCRLVGQRFFDHMAREFIKTYPPTSPLLMCYGAEMPRFLRDFPPVAELPYLPDVARLEHLWAESFNGGEGAGFDPAQLQKIAPERFNDVVFRFLPSMRLMASAYPVVDIWCANQAENSALPAIDLDSGGCRLVIFRRDLEVEILTLKEPAFDFLIRLSDGHTLGRAAESVALQQADFDLQDALQGILTHGLIDGFEFKQ